MKKHLIYSKLSLLAFFILLVACEQDNNLPKPKDTYVSFTSKIINKPQTRSNDKGWLSGDKIGVFAIKNKALLQSNTIIKNYSNISFTTLNGNGFFEADNEQIYYPKDNSFLDFIAYHPYNPNLTNYNYPIDITKQQDFLYSNNLKGVNQHSSTKTLHFKRMLPKVVFNIAEKNNNALNNLKVYINEVKTKASFSLSTGSFTVNNASVKNVALNVTGSSTNLKATSFLLPSKQNIINIRIEIGTNKVYSYTIPNALESGKIYTYDIKLDKVSLEVTPKKDYTEIPYYTAGGKAPNSYEARHEITNLSWLNSSYLSNYTKNKIRNYTVLYDIKNHIPYWIAYPMHPVYLKSGNRTDYWDYDPKVPKQYQPNILNNSYSTSTYNRGHMLASADRSATKSLNRTTFYATNMVPQNRKMNGGKWNDLEQKVRYWCKQQAYDTLYVVTGSILPPKGQIKYTTDKHGKKVAVPEYLYKALLRQEKSTKKYYSIAFKMKNENTGVPYQSSMISVSELEKATGFTFFSNIPNAEKVKEQKNMINWK